MKNSWIPVIRGRTVRQARVGVGELNEEHVSRQGFFGTATMLYHANPSRDPLRVEGPLAVGIAPLSAILPADAEDFSATALRVLYNDELDILISKRQEAMPYLLRNIDADTLYIVHDGQGVMATEFGPIPYEPGDFILIPKGVTYRVMPSCPLVAMIVESKAQIDLTEHQQVGRHAPFDPGVIFIPQVEPYDWPRQDEWEVRLKHEGTYSSAFYPNLPFDLVGWQGDYFPFKLNMRDIRPITSERLHLAPSSWSVFEAASFMCVAFLPVQAVSDPEAEELPSRHRNIDSEEAILFRTPYGDVVGHFPQGITHGPSADAREKFAKIRKPGMQRVVQGVSIDVYRRLKRTPEYLASVAAPDWKVAL